MAELTNTSLNGDANLIAYYKFNSGALTTDSSGSGRTLTNNNSVGETASGKYGYAANFGDPNTNKTFSRAEDIWNNGTMSMVGWAKRNNTSDTHRIAKCSDAGADKQLFFGATSAAVEARIFRVGVGYDIVSASITPDIGWHHYALTLTTGVGGTMKIYYDGVEKASGSVTNASGSVGQTEQFVIGEGDGGYFEGFLDDVAFFNRVLTQPEINELYITSGGFFNLL